MVRMGSYAETILSLFGSNLIGYWQLNETSGTTAADSSAQGHDGTYSDPLLANTAMPSRIGGKAPYFDGSNDEVSIISAGLAEDFDKDVGSALVWAKVYDGAVWTDGNFRYVWSLVDDGSNYVGLFKTSTNNLLRWVYSAGGTAEVVDKSSVSETGWMMLAITWDKPSSEMKAYYNGTQQGTTQAIAGTFSGDLTSARFGKYLSSYPWNGYLAHGILIDRVATAAEILQVYNGES